jgi:hypothetical protein
MTLGGWIFLILGWGLVLSLVSFSLWKLMREK